jgi:hypothetical protein
VSTDGDRSGATVRDGVDRPELDDVSRLQLIIDAGLPELHTRHDAPRSVSTPWSVSGKGCPRSRTSRPAPARPARWRSHGRRPTFVHRDAVGDQRELVAAVELLQWVWISPTRPARPASDMRARATSSEWASPSAPALRDVGDELGAGVVPPRARAGGEVGLEPIEQLGLLHEDELAAYVRSAGRRWSRGGDVALHGPARLRRQVPDWLSHLARSGVSPPRPRRSPSPSARSPCPSAPRRPAGRPRPARSAHRPRRTPASARPRHRR